MEEVPPHFELIVSRAPFQYASNSNTNEWRLFSEKNAEDRTAAIKELRPDFYNPQKEFDERQAARTAILRPSTPEPKGDESMTHDVERDEGGKYSRLKDFDTRYGSSFN